MRLKVLFAGLLLSLLAAHSARADFELCPANTVLAGPTSAGAPQAPLCRPLVLADIPSFTIPGATVAYVPTNLQLQNTTTVFSTAIVYRAGYYTPGDGGAAFYSWSSTTCSAPDNGAQVSTSAGCWNLIKGAQKPTPQIWGCKGDNVADDTACFQAAVTAQANQTLFVDGPYKYKLTAGITSVSPIDLEGPHVSPGAGYYSVTCTYGLFAGVANLNLLTLQGSGSAVRGICFQMASNVGINTSGAAITLQIGEGMVLEYNEINFPFGGIDIWGGASPAGASFATNKGDFIQHNNVVRPSGSGSYAYRIGFNGAGDGAPSDIYFADNAANCVSTAPGNPIGYLILQAQGLYFTGKNNPFNCNIGTEIIPGANQAVINNWFTDTALGDSSVGAYEVLIDTGAASATVGTIDFTSIWAAAVTAGTIPLVIKNSGGGIVNGLHFERSRFFASGAPLDLIDILAGVSLSIQDSSLCGNATNGLKVESGWPASYGDLSITGNRIGNCDRLGSGPTNGISLPTGGAGQGVYTIVGNNMDGSGTPLVWTPAGENMTLLNNPGIDNGQGGPIVSASSTALPFNNTVTISGSATIQNLTGVSWQHQITLIPTTGSTWSLTTGGNICNALTPVAKVPVIAWYAGDVGCWYVK